MSHYKSNYNTYSINGVPTFSEFVLPNDSLYYYGKALSSVSYLFINNHSDWRIPDQDEMTFIVQKFGETIFGSQQKSFWTRTVVSQTAQNVCNSISPSSYMPIVLTVNMMDLNNKPIGPIFLSVNPYPFNAYGCGAVNPAKANIILTMTKSHKDRLINLIAAECTADSLEQHKRTDPSWQELCSPENYINLRNKIHTLIDNQSTYEFYYVN